MEREPITQLLPVTSSPATTAAMKEGLAALLSYQLQGKMPRQCDYLSLSFVYLLSIK